MKIEQEYEEEFSLIEFNYNNKTVHNLCKQKRQPHVHVQSVCNKGMWNNGNFNIECIFENMFMRGW